MKAITPLISGVIFIAFTIVASILVVSSLSSVTKTQTESITAQCTGALLEIISTKCKYKPLIDSSTVLYLSMDSVNASNYTLDSALNNHVILIQAEKMFPVKL